MNQIKLGSMSTEKMVLLIVNSKVAARSMVLYRALGCSVCASFGKPECKDLGRFSARKLGDMKSERILSQVGFIGISMGKNFLANQKRSICDSISFLNGIGMPSMANALDFLKSGITVSRNGTNGSTRNRALQTSSKTIWA